MWQPSALRRLEDMLYAQLSAIRQVFNKQEETIRHAAEASQSQSREIAGIVASAIETAHKDVPGYEYAQRDKEYRLQRRLLLATVGAGIVGAFYATVAALQLADFDESLAISQIAARQSRIQAAASQRAAELTAQALKDTEKQFSLYKQQTIQDKGTVIYPLVNFTPDRGLGIWVNSEKGTLLKPATISFEITRYSLPRTELTPTLTAQGHPLKDGFTIPALFPSVSSHGLPGEATGKTYSDFKQPTGDALTQTETVKVEGHLRFNNGFDWYTVPFCSFYIGDYEIDAGSGPLPGRFLACEEFFRTLALSRKLLQEKQPGRAH